MADGWTIEDDTPSAPTTRRKASPPKTDTSGWSLEDEPSAPEGAPLIGGAPTLVDNSGWGGTFDRRLEEAQGERPGLDTDNEFGGPRVFTNGISNPLSTVRDIADVAARGNEYLMAGINTGLEKLGPIGGAIGAGMEAFPAAGGEVGLALPHGANVLSKGRGTVAPLGEDAFLTRTRELMDNPETTRADFDALAEANGRSPFDEDLDAALRHRDRPTQVLSGEDKNVRTTADELGVKPSQLDRAMQEPDFQQQVELTRQRDGEAPAAEVPKEWTIEDVPIDPKLKAEADAFVANKAPEPTAEELFAKPAPITPESLAEEANAFKGTPEPTAADVFGSDLPSPSPEPTPESLFGKPEAAPEEAPTSTKRQDEVAEHVTNLTSEWKNAPEIEVHDNFDHLPEADRDAVGVTTPEGKVLINASKVAGKPEMIKAVTYHESLGHNGLTQKFGDALDSELENFYDNSTGFKAQVDKWLEENPHAYDQGNVVARAADEVLAEMSEKGIMPASLMNRLKNRVKQFGRKIGIKSTFSDREIETILGMAHDAVINGKSVAENGFRGGDRFKITRPTPLDDTKEGETKTYRPYPDSTDPNRTYNRFRHVTEDGKVVEGTYEVKNKKIADFSITSKGGAASIGPKAIRQIGRDLMKEHDATGLSGNRISGARPAAEEVSVGNRFKRDKEVEDSKGKKYSLVGEPLPEKGVSPAALGIDGKVYVAKRGQGHFQIYEAFPPRYVGDNRWSNAGMFVSADGKLLNREQALKWVTENEKKVRSNLDEGLDALDYRDQVSGSPRFMRERKKTLSPDGMVTKHDASDLLDYIADGIEGLKQTYTIPELNRMADDIAAKGAAAYLKKQGLTEQQIAAQLLAGKKLYTGLINELKDLQKRYQDEPYSPSLHAKIRQKLGQTMAIGARLDGDTAESGRTQRVLREVTTSKHTAAEQLRYMVEHGDALSNPEGIGAVLDKVISLEKEDGPAAAIKFIRKASKASHLTDIINLPRAMMSTMDLSAPLRQGLPLIGTKSYWASFGKMFKQFVSENAHKEVMEAIRNDPNYPLMNKAKLGITDVNGPVSAREELFVSKFSGKIPLVKGSERAYNGFLNKLRADTFNRLVKQSQAAGIDFTKDPKALRDIGRYVNNATGRGELGSFESAGPQLTAAFFSPRLIASRVNLLNPMTYYKLSPVVRREAIKNLIKVGALATTVLGIAKMAGADTESDPRSSDFGKIKVGNTRYDIGGGFNQFITLGARLYTNETAKNGEVTTLGKKYGAPTRLNVAEKFIENKAAPVPGFVLDYLRGKDPTGKDFSVGSAVASRFVPLFLQDVKSVYDDQKKGDWDVDAMGKSAAMSVPGLFGVGIQTYDAKDRNSGLGLDKDTSAMLKDLEKDNDDKHVVAKPKKTFKRDGVDKTLTDEEYVPYAKKVGELFQVGMKQATALPGWKDASVELKREATKEVMAEAVKETKDTLYPEGQAQPAATGWTIQ